MGKIANPNLGNWEGLQSQNRLIREKLAEVNLSPSPVFDWMTHTIIAANRCGHRHRRGSRHAFVTLPATTGWHAPSLGDALASLHTEGH
jgi:hypothetical protein